MNYFLIGGGFVKIALQNTKFAIDHFSRSCLKRYFCNIFKIWQMTNLKNTLLNV